MDAESSPSPQLTSARPPGRSRRLVGQPPSSTQTDKFVDDTVPPLNSHPLQPTHPRHHPQTLASPGTAVPSFSAFRAQAASTAIASPIRRKPLSPGLDSPQSARFSVPQGGPSIRLERFHERDRASSVSSASIIVRDLDQHPHGDTPSQTPALDSRPLSLRSLGDDLPSATPLAQNVDLGPKPTRPELDAPSHARAEPSPGMKNTRIQEAIVDGHRRASLMAPFQNAKPVNLKLTVESSSTARKTSNHSDESYDSTSTSKPRSPGAKLTSFFGWKSSSSPGLASSATSLSDKTPSPGPSPRSPKLQSSAVYFASAAPAHIDVMKASGVPNATSANSSLNEIEDELREISAELASSIRREMDLEDLVERLQAEAANAPTHSHQNRRTSDYYSDSGTSSIRYLNVESETKEQELERMQRKTEQEKAQLRLDLANRVQEERSRRVVLEEHISTLEHRVREVNREHTQSVDATGRVKELEASLEDLRRRLSEEKQVKENFEDLLTALRGEIQEHRNERDNLRDEIVPQMRARVEGLESEAAEFQKLTYENARMQQELQSLKDENTTLMNSRKMQQDMPGQQSRINAIAEEGAAPTGLGLGLSRSMSMARGATKSSSLTRSNSSKERESRESLADRVKDIEAQRDALHRALKSLLDRQDHQSREADKRIRALELERDRALSGDSRRGYDREVAALREEINHLRRRADDALEQKWQCEKGLSGLKMDLDRAEQETSSLRSLLQENDILVPDLAGADGHLPRPDGRTPSGSLEKAYRELQTTYALSLARIREIEGESPGEHSSQLGAANAMTAKTMELLRKSISDVGAERDFAQQQAEQYRLQAESLQSHQGLSMMEETTLAGQLRASAQRVEELAVQVRQQLASNNALRQRLADAIGRGEREQKTSAQRIRDLQSKLKSLEDKVMMAQQYSEDTVAKHEEEVRELRESHSSALLRMKNGIMSPGSRFTSKSPISPFFTARSPRLDMTSSGAGVSMSEETKTAFLAKRVEDLEVALSLADKEMEEVVSRMNMAQIEVMELQSERDEAMRQSRRLRTAINQEREKVKIVLS